MLNIIAENPKQTFDEYGNCIKEEYDVNVVIEHEYDAHGNIIHTKVSDGFEEWNTWDYNKEKDEFLLTSRKTTEGLDFKAEYDDNGTLIYKSIIQNGNLVALFTVTHVDENGSECYYEDTKDKRWVKYDNQGRMTYEKIEPKVFEMFADYNDEEHTVTVTDNLSNNQVFDLDVVGHYTSLFEIKENLFNNEVDE